MWINTLLSILIISLGAIHIIAIEATDNNDKILRCYINGSFSTFQDFSFDNPTPLLNSSCYDPSKQTVFYTYGFGGKNNGPSVETLFRAYVALNFNFILVGWEKGASNESGVLGYPTAAENALIDGKQLGQVLITLTNAGLSAISIILIGFSLGAHFMGEAGKEFQTSGQIIPLLIGLDPAGPLFLVRGINPQCAIFVCILHTNPSGLGTTQSRGRVDVWPNCPSRVQPACAAAGGGIGFMTPENLCSHDTSWRYYAEAITMPNTHVARPASSCKSFRAGNGGNLTFTIQVNLDTSRRGNFYYVTNAAPIYGRGVAGANPN